MINIDEENPMANLSDLKPNPNNPRKVTEKKLQMLKKSLEEFGDLSGFVYNRRTQQLVGGHRRQEVLPKDAQIVREKEYEKPNEKGTVAVGYVLIGNERFSFREVDWDENKEKAANIAANNGAGEWDTEKLMAMFDDIKKANLNPELTMFSTDEVNRLLAKSKPATQLPPQPSGGASSAPGEKKEEGLHCPKCGFQIK